MRRGLQALPELDPPPGVWERSLAAADAPRPGPRRVWAAIGAAAAVTSVAIGYLATQPEHPVMPSSTVIVAEAANRPRVPFVALLEESAALEQLLAGMPRRPVMAGSTAATIAGLEDRIAFVDGQLAYAASFDVPQRQREALWTERVDLMNALVHVRYASAQQFVVER